MSARHSPLHWRVVQPKHDPQAYDVAYGESDYGNVAKLPWGGKANAAYIVKACNAYPLLVALIRECLEGTERGCHEWNDDARALLRDLGEQDASRIPDFRDWPQSESRDGDLTTFGMPLKAGQ